MMNPLKKLTELFKKKEEEDDLPEEWKTKETAEDPEIIEISEIPEETDNPSKLSKALTVIPHFPKPSRKIVVPGLTKLKRILAFTLMVLNIIVGLLGFNPVTIVFYALTALILLDYLFKTRFKQEPVKWYHLDNMEEE